MSDSIKKNTSNVYLWWKIDPVDFDLQLSQYETLGTFKATRKVSGLLLLLSCVITTGFVMANLAPPSSLVDSVILLILAGLVFYGKKWAIFIAMIYWTLSKIFAIIGSPTFAVVQIIWWCAYMKAFYMAYKIEEKRIEPKAPLT